MKIKRESDRKGNFHCISAQCLILLSFLILVNSIVVAQDSKAQVQKEQKSIFIYNINIVDVVTGQILEHQDVAITRDLITKVAPNKKIKAAKGSLIINGEGKYLLPGFADMHVHLYTEGDILTYILNGITTVRNMAGDSTHLRFRKRIQSGEMIGPRIITAGAVVETGSLTHPDNVLLTDTTSAREEVKRQKKEGYDFIKVYNEMEPTIYSSILRAASEFKMPVVGHVPEEVGLEGVLSGGQKSIEHFRGYVQKLVPSLTKNFRDRSVAWTTIDDSRIPAIVKETVLSGIWNCPTFTFTVHELSPGEDHKRLMLRPEIKLLSLAGMPDREKNQGYLSDFDDNDFAATQKGLESQFKLLRALDKANAKLLVGTDSWLSGFAFADELELLTKGGLTPSRVLRMATYDAAKFLGEEDQFGRVASGQKADLVILDANPLDNISNVRKIRMVVKSGKAFSRADLDNLTRSLVKGKN